MQDKKKFYINGKWVQPQKKNDFNVINPCFIGWFVDKVGFVGGGEYLSDETPSDCALVFLAASKILASSGVAGSCRSLA